ncbi:MAG: hypothetical protein LBV39_02770, partial [Bacteroidales bacterium]|nr:hypothetical protein [Bacteroidales bacterium]
SFYAGAVEADAEALYSYSKVFELCPRYSQAAMTSFRWRISRTDTVLLLALCENNAEKAVVHAMIGFTCFHPTLEPLLNVYDLQPESPYLETLLIREISKIEAGLTENNAHKDDMLFHARQLRELAIQFAGRKEVLRPALWHTAAAYMAQLSGNHETASLLVSIAEQELESPDIKVSEQLLAVKLLVETDISTFNADTEARILPSLEWLLANVQDTASESHAFFQRTVAHYFAEKLPAIYLNMHQPAKAALSTGIAMKYSQFARAAIYELNDFALLDKKADIPQLEMMLKQLAAPDALSAFDAFLYRHCRQSVSALSELTGTKHLRKLQFREAASYFKNLSDASKVFHLNNNPFAPPAAFARQSGANADEFSFHSKLSFAVEMAELQKRIQQKTATPDDLFRYACGLFQMSTFGNSWQLLSYRWTSSDRGQWEKAQPTDELYHYFHPSTAREYFMKALEASRNKELKAQCLFMASFCYQLTLSDELYIRQNGKYIPTGSYFLKNPYFNQLQQQYAKTNFYTDAVTRCSYLADFAR